MPIFARIYKLTSFFNYKCSSTSPTYLPSFSKSNIRTECISKYITYSSFEAYKHGRGCWLPFAKICQGLLAYDLILSEMQRIALLPVALLEICVRMCVYVVCGCVFDRTKTVWNKSVNVAAWCRTLKRHPITYLATYFLYVIYSNTNNLDGLNLIVS